MCVYIYIDMCMLYVYVYVYYIRAGHPGSAFDSLEGLVWGVPEINSGFVGDFGTPTKPCGVMQIFPRITRNVRQTNIGKTNQSGMCPKIGLLQRLSMILFILHGITHHTPLSWHGYVVGRCRTKNHQSKAAEIASPLIHDSWLICFRTIYSNTTMWYQLITLMVDCFARMVKGQWY